MVGTHRWEAKAVVDDRRRIGALVLFGECIRITENSIRESETHIIHTKWQPPTRIPRTPQHIYQRRASLLSRRTRVDNGSDIGVVGPGHAKEGRASVLQGSGVG